MKKSKKWKTSVITAYFPVGPEAVWRAVTDNEHFGWRSDLSAMSVSEDGDSFTELSSDGIRTQFKITCRQPCRRYELELRSRSMTGRRSGLFAAEGSGTRVTFAERVWISNPFLRLFAGTYLHSRQKRYVADLSKAVQRP